MQNRMFYDPQIVSDGYKMINSNNHGFVPLQPVSKSAPSENVQTTCTRHYIGPLESEAWTCNVSELKLLP